MAVLKDLIVHGASRFLGGINTDSVKANTIDATNGYFKYLKAIDGDIENLSVQDLLAQKATVVGLLDVKGELHTNKWTNTNIANIGGVFYISPTVISTTATVVIGGSANSRTLTVSGGSFATTTVPTWNGTSESTSAWVVGSRVMVTGSITYNNVEYPLGTCTGYISGALSSTGFTVQQIYSEALEDIFSIVGTASLVGSNIQISMYEIGPGNNNNQSNNASYKPVGILMTSYGMADKSTHIDIYGGVNAKNTSSKTSGMADPNVRIGYLGGLDSYTDSAGNTRQPTGWGIYTDNGFFKGVVVADSGSIGHFTIDSNSIYSGSHSAYNSNNAGIFLGRPSSSSSDYYIAGGPQALWYLKSDGSAKIGAMTLSSAGVLAVPAANISGTLTASQVDVSGIITAGSIVTNTLTGGTFNTADYIRVSTQASSSLTIGTSGAKTDWRIIAGKTFGVDKSGNLYATSVNITGEITASKLTISSGATIGGDGAKPILNSTFLKVDDTGLMLYDGSSGESTSSTVETNNVFVTPEQVQIRSGTNILAKYGASVTIGDETMSHIYMDNDEFMINSVVDGSIVPAFSVQTEAAELTDTSRIRKIINVSTKTLAKTSPTSQTIDVNFSNYGLTVTDCDSIFCEAFYTKETSLTNWAPGPAFSIDISTIVNAGSNGYTKTSGYFNFKFTYNSSGNKITVNPSITSTTSYKGIYIVVRRIDYYQTTTSKRPCYNLGTRAEGSILGAYSVVTGNGNEASGNYSKAGGCHTIARGMYQTVIGRYNTPSGNNTSMSDSDAAFIIGNGTDDDHRGNTLVATYNGNLTVAYQIWARTLGADVSNGVLSTAGSLYFISKGSTSAGSKSKGIYTVNGASTTSRWVIEVDQNNNLWFNGQASSVSDLKKKDVISDYDWKVDKFIRGLKPIAYYKKHDDGTMGDRIHYGFGAQEVKKLVDDLEFDELGVYHANRIRYDEDGCKCEDGDYHGENVDDSELAWGLVYEEFIAPMVLEIQQLMDRVDKLELEIKKLKSQ